MRPSCSSAWSFPEGSVSVTGHAAPGLTAWATQAMAAHFREHPHDHDVHALFSCGAVTCSHGLGNGELFQSCAGAKRKGARSARPRRTSGQTSSSSPNWPRASAASRSKCGVRPEACDHLVAGGVCPARACPSFSRSCCWPRGSWARRSGGCGRKRRSRRRARDFVSGVSHQHRTPPAQIRMFGETPRPGRVRNEEKRATPGRDRRDEARRLHAPGRQLLTFSQGATRLDAPAPGRDRPRRARRRSRRPEFAGARRRHPLILKGASRAPLRTRRSRSWIWYGARPAMPRSR